MKLPNVQNSRISQKNYPIFGGKDPFAAAGIRPELALDFEQQRFRQGANTTAPNVYTATRTGLATQLNSAGNLVWNAHNLVTHSEDLTEWDVIGAPVVTANTVEDNSTNFEGVQTSTIPVPVGSKCSIRLRVIKDEVSSSTRFSLFRINKTSDVDLAFDSSSGEFSNVSGREYDSVSVLDDGDSWVLSLQATIDTAPFNFQIYPAAGAKADVTTVTDSDYSSASVGLLSVTEIAAYRSDLGGMAPVPLTRRVAGSTTYVPTTSAAVYLPREEAYAYVSGELVGPYYQKESDARTNLVTYSEDFTDASWTKTNVTVTPSATTSPDGTENAQKLVPSAVLGFTQGVDRLITLPGQTVISCYAKAGEYNYFAFVLNSNSGQSAVFDLTNGTVSQNSGGYGAAITSEGNGWYRCSISLNSAALNRVALAIRGTSTVTNYTPDGVSGGFIYGAQLEQGSTPSSYIPTAGSSVIRPADSTTIAAGNMPAYTNALSFQLEGLVTYADEGLALEVEFYKWLKDGANFIRENLRTDGANTGQAQFGQVNSGIVDFVVSSATTYSPDINVPFNIASRHGSTFVNGAVDGTALTADTTPTALPDLSATTFELAPTFNGFIKTFRVWAEDIGDSGISEASQ